MLKKCRGFWCVVVLCSFIFLLGAGSMSHAQAPIKLTYSNFFPPTHIQSQLAEAWCKEVEKRTNGKVVVEYYPGQTLTKGAQCYDGVVNGMSDIGFSVLGYTRGRFPLMAAVDLPMGYTSGEEATRVVNAVYEKFKPAELNDTEVMYLHAHGAGLIHTKGKPIHKLEDLKGLKIRSHGTSAAAMKALGATPVAMPMPETYQALQKGVVDGAAYPWESNKGWKLGEVTNYCVANFSSAYTTSFFVVMNKEKWNSLPDDAKKVIREINKEWIPKHAAAWDKSDMEGVVYFLNQGGEVIGQDEKEAARWKAAVQPVIHDYVKEAEAKGLKAKEVVDYIEMLLKEPSK